MRRRGFTVLEIVLAAAIGSIVVATSVGLLASIDRTDVRLETRHRQRMELSRTRTAIQRAMTSRRLLTRKSSSASNISPTQP